MHLIPYTCMLWKRLAIILPEWLHRNIVRGMARFMDGVLALEWKRGDECGQQQRREALPGDIVNHYLDLIESATAYLLKACYESVRSLKLHRSIYSDSDIAIYSYAVGSYSVFANEPVMNYTCILRKLGPCDRPGPCARSGQCAMQTLVDCLLAGSPFLVV